VSIGQRSGTATQIAEGLEEGAVVITHPSDRVHDGVEAAPR
jgi:HlyD family secretion protein